MGKLFGTDGIRGVVGENLTADMAFRVGQAVGTVLMEDKGSRPTVVIGKDTRISSDMLESALMAGLCSVGSDVKPVGTIPTPAVAYLTVQEKADAGIVISASHNPYEHNGIKVFSGQGYKLSDSVEDVIPSFLRSCWVRMGPVLSSVLMMRFWPGRAWPPSDPVRGSEMATSCSSEYRLSFGLRPIDVLSDDLFSK